MKTASMRASERQINRRISRARPTVLLLAPLYPPAYRGGGPIRTMEAMVQTHGDRFTFRVVTSDTDWGESTPLGVETDQWAIRENAEVIYTREKSYVSFLRALWLGARLNPDFVYINSFLNPKFSILPVTLARLGFFGRATIVLAPRGEFGDAALSIKPKKKHAFLSVSRLLKLHKNVVWHASTETEAKEIRAHRPKARIVVRLNESTLPITALRPSPSSHEEVRLVFVSRISEIKGVDILLEALSTVETKVVIDLYGSAQNPNYLSKCHAIADRLPTNIQVTFRGSIDNSRVRAVFANADAFFLPTEHENFGHAIAESLSAGCPVFIEDSTPWTEVINDGGGRIVSAHTVESWANALRDYCSSTTEQRAAMKLGSAEAYERWREINKGESVFDLIARRRIT